MSIESFVRNIREGQEFYETYTVPLSYQGVSKDKIREVLSRIDRYTDDMVDTVFALMDNETDSFYKNPPDGSKFFDGATTAHLGAHIGILQRGGNTKLDREGRDYWIKPLREIGAIIPIYLDPKSRKFVIGHPVPKSPNLGYKLADDFVEVLKADDGMWQYTLDQWINEDTIRKRLQLQAKAEGISRQNIDSGHRNLIIACQNIYIPNFLPGYTILFVDVEDGQRVTEEETVALSNAEIEITLADAMPDVLLVNPDTNALWVIEAVTSDGEVDDHKVVQILDLAKRSRRSFVGFTTAYESWKDVARRQGQHKNIAPNTYIWILEDPSKHFHVIEMRSEISAKCLKVTI